MFSISAIALIKSSKILCWWKVSLVLFRFVPFRFVSQNVENRDHKNHIPVDYTQFNEECKTVFIKLYNSWFDDNTINLVLLLGYKNSNSKEKLLFYSQTHRDIVRQISDPYLWYSSYTSDLFN